MWGKQQEDDTIPTQFNKELANLEAEERIIQDTQKQLEQIINQQELIDDLEKQAEALKVKNDLEKQAEALTQERETTQEELKYLYESDFDAAQKKLEDKKLEIEKKQEYKQQESYAGDCSLRPPETFCVGFSDDYIWLISDSIIGWENIQEDDKNIQIAFGNKASYYHVLNTDLVRESKHFS